MCKKIEVLERSKVIKKNNVRLAICDEVAETGSLASSEEITVSDLDRAFTGSIPDKHFKKVRFLCRVIAYQAANLRLLNCEIVYWFVLFPNVAFLQVFNLNYAHIAVVKNNLAHQAKVLNNIV